MIKVWFCGFCFFLLTVGCTSSNSGNRDVSNQTQPPKAPTISISSVNSKHELYKQIEQISRTAQGLMTETPTGLQRIKGLLPDGTVVAHKTGTSRTVGGVTAATNDVGLVTLPNGLGDI